MAWTKIAELRGPAGYNATGAAEDAAAVGGFLRGAAGANDANAALVEVTGVNVRNHGAIGDGVIDDTVAVQAAITAAGAGGRVIFPAGDYKLGTITTLLHQTFEGSTQFLGTGPAPQTRLYFSGLTGAQVGIQMGENNTFNNLLIWGPGYAVGTCVGVNSASGSPRFNNCGFYNWATDVHLTGAFYPVFENCEWSYSAVGVELTNCYNVTVIAPRFNMANSGLTAFGIAFLGAARALNVFGGSIENYGASGAIVPTSAQAINLYGVYFESPSTLVASWGIQAQTLTKVSILMEGCFIYLAEHNRFIGFGLSTESSLTSRGNHFVCAVGSTTTPIAYVLGSSPAQDVMIEGDNWSEVAKGSYIDSVAALTAGGISGVNIRYPGTYADFGRKQFIGRDVIVDATHTIRTGAGLTAARPAAATVLAGSQWFDTTLGKPIWSNGTVWKDAAGTTV